MRTVVFIRLFDVSSKINYNWMKKMMMYEMDIIRQGKTYSITQKVFLF